MTQREIIRKHLNKSDWEITKDKCDSTRAHRRHLAANGKHETERKIYCTNVHLRIIGILITSVYNSVLSLPPLHIDATGYAPGLPSPMRPISVLAQNLGGIPRVLIQVLFSLPTCLLKGGVAKSYEGMQNACLLCGQKH